MKENYPYWCGPGWWPILDKYIPQILAIAPDAEIDAKEKYGTLRIQVWGDHITCLGDIHNLTQAAEDESAVVCEECGKPGELRTERSWIVTLCDECNKKGKE